MSELMEEENEEENEQENEEKQVRKGLSTWCAIKICAKNPITKQLGRMINKYLTNPRVVVRPGYIVALVEIKSVGKYDEQLQELEHDLPQREQEINDEYIKIMQAKHLEKYHLGSTKSRFKTLTPYGFELGELIVLKQPIKNRRTIQGICYLKEEELYDVLADDEVTFGHLDRSQRYGIMTIGLGPYLLMAEQKKHFEIRMKNSKVLDPDQAVKPYNYLILI